MIKKLKFNIEKKITKYTIGIIFDKKLKKTVMILKNRPKWQSGKYNFPGGHVEKEEKLVNCVAREIQEECGIIIPENEWKHIGFINNTDFYIVGIFTAIYIPKTHGLLKTMKNQKVILTKNNKLPKNIISNVSWLIQFGINFWKQGNIDDLKFGIFYYKYK